MLLRLKRKGRQKLGFGLKMHDDAKSPVASRIEVDTEPENEEEENEERQIMVSASMQNDIGS